MNDASLRFRVYASNKKILHNIFIRTFTHMEVLTFGGALFASFASTQNSTKKYHAAAGEIAYKRKA